MTGYQSKKAAALDEDGMYLVHHTNHSEDILQMVAQPAQEPKSVTYKEVQDAMNAMTKGTIGQRIAAEDLGKLKLYTAPPQRPWVDLTDEEIQDCDPHEDCWHLFKIARAVLAKSKEKNT